MNRFAHRLLIPAFAIGGILLSSGCGNFMAELAANGTVDIMKMGAAGFDNERDLEMARSGAQGNIMMMKGLLEVVPGNADLVGLLASTYASFAFGFIEDDMEDLEAGSSAWNTALNRAFDFYERARGLAMKRLQMSHEELPDLVTCTDGALEAALSQLTEEDAGTLFWFSYAWSGMVNQMQDDPFFLLQLPRVETLMNRVLALNEAFFDGGAHLFFGVLKSSAPSSLSDETEASAMHFDRAIELGGAHNLMAKVLKARFLSVAKRDPAMFTAILEEVLETPVDVLPSHTLSNALAKRRAARWLNQKDRFFPEN